MRQRNQMPAWAVGIVAALALGAAQAEQQHAHERVAPASAASSSGAEGQALRAVRDQVTGKLRAPTGEELEAMRANERAERKARGQPETADPAPLRVQLHANGMRSAVLGSEYLMTLKGERRSDGSVRRFHPHGGHEHSVNRANGPTE